MSRIAFVDLGAISHNVETLRAHAGGTAAMVVVKADGYGHGAVPVARAALEGGAEWLGTAAIEEALALRAAGISGPILAWLHETDAPFAVAVDAGIDLGISSVDQLEAVVAAAPGAALHLKIDTGLGRNGASAQEWLRLVEAAAGHERAGHVRVRGVWSHLAHASEADDLDQVARFEEARAAAAAAGLDPEVRHLAATAGALRLPSAHYDLVRLGIGTYGLSPFDDATSADLGLVPAMTLTATIASVKRVPAGHGVSYGYDYRTSEATTLALIPLGYADGIPRTAAGRGRVWIGDRVHPVVGRVAMDQIVADVGDHPVAVGDLAVVFGDPATGVPSADEWARAAGSINYELVTRIGPRVRREYR